MNLDPDTCYQTLLSRDRRFDGWFFVGVTSTGIYCRPVCPVRTPKQRNCRFFPNMAAAEKAGFRPCLRCRPELAPGNGLLDASARLAQAAATLIEEGFLNTASLAELAARIGVTDRHLRRIFVAEYGVSMIEFAQTQRLLLAKRLLTETRLPVTIVALTAGFGSVRRLNDLFLKQYGLNPLRFRKEIDSHPQETITFSLGYRPPFSWSGVLAFLAHRQIAGVEHIGDDSYTRVIELKRGTQNIAGWIGVTHAPHRYAIDVKVSISLTPVIAPVIGRVRRMFDLSARPDLIDMHLGDLAAELPGMRVPGTFDGFEVAARAIVGQQISVSNARAILSRIADRFGTKLAGPFDLSTTFPSATVFADIPATALQEAGITRIRAETIIALAREVSTGRIVLEPLAPLDETLAALRSIRGIGEWTVQYIAMRALAWPNAFPDSDAVLKKQLGYSSAPALNQHAQRWQPWRAYATLHVWRRHQAQRE
ncbi:AlkA N-terminal domain-containing protein [Paraburkholderia sp. B3]|uniref:AlkA N-terminal domain-containing protein n=1 Tax=Paraburkholderia sp. B3 TaxID=3134791 RepID=UPI0039829CC1